MYGFFIGCKSLTTVDISSFDTSNVRDMSSMFSGCFNLRTIYVSNSFVTTKVRTYSNMFYRCRKLVGGAGTAWNSSMENDLSYAKIDGGTSSPGLFTLKV